jgi:hypothetical protein
MVADKMSDCQRTEFWPFFQEPYSYINGKAGVSMDQLRLKIKPFGIKKAVKKEKKDG